MESRDAAALVWCAALPGHACRRALHGASRRLCVGTRTALVSCGLLMYFNDDSLSDPRGVIDLFDGRCAAAACACGWVVVDACVATGQGYRS